MHPVGLQQTTSEEEFFYTIQCWWPRRILPLVNFCPSLSSPLFVCVRQGVALQPRLIFNSEVILLPQFPQCWDYKHMTPFKNGLKRPMLKFRLQCATVLQNNFIPLIHSPSGEIQKELSLLCKGCGDQTTMKWEKSSCCGVWHEANTQQG